MATVQERPQRSGLEAAREAFARGEWLTARDGLQAEAEVLGPAERELLSRATWFLGDVPGSMAQAETAFAGYLRDGRATEAADLGVRLGLEWGTRGDFAIATAWLGRAGHLLDSVPVSATTGYLRYARALMTLEIEGDPAPVAEASAEVGELAARFGDPALACLSQVLRGVAAIRDGEAEDGFQCLDEAMLPVMAGQVDPLWAGDVYCTIIHVCEGLADLTRMRAWTDALARWARPLSDQFMYAGVTRVHQLQLLSAEGDWDTIEAEMGTWSEDLVGAHVWMAGAGFAELGDVRRLRGDLRGAREAYARARSLGIDAQPGEARLLLDDGRPAEALAALLGAIGGADRVGRARLLLPAVEAALRTRDRELATRLTVDLEQTAAHFGTPGLLARAHQARAALLVEHDRPREALPHLEAAAQVYRAQRFRHALAGVHEQLAGARAALGDHAAAAAELATASAVYTQLGARPDLQRLSAKSRLGEHPGGLTHREVEVLARVAGGASNREVAAQLVISEKTVGRHLANIYGKLEVTTRTAAAAWAHAHGVGSR